MLLSYNWLKEFIDIEVSTKELDNILTMLGIEVESISSQADKFRNFIVAEVSEKAKHPDADKLSVCMVNTGNEVLQVICGAPNVEAGQKVIFGKVGAVVPNGGFKLDKRKIRGVESNGMICSLAELGMSEASDGIHILPENAEVGVDISNYFGLDDIIFELGLTPNKQDCLSHLGIARELAAYFRKQINYTEVILNESDKDINDLVKISIDDSAKCPRYSARIVRNCKIVESPEWLKRRLENIGLRPRNAAVDVTNLILMESGQPLHAFDLDMINNSKIIVKTANEGDKFVTLDGKERILNNEMLMICDDRNYIAIGGVMGGQNSEISDNTTNILIESAYFEPASVRKTSKKLSLQTDSSYRFERGVDISNVTKALDRAARLIAELTSGEIAKGLIDVYPSPRAKKRISLEYNKVRKLLGINIENIAVNDILKSLQFEMIENKGDNAVFEVPYHRVDCEYDVDLIEEVARLYNYDNISEQFTSEINFSISDVSLHLQVPKLRNKIRQWFVNRGYHEILTPNQIDPRSASLFSDNPVTIANPLGEELSIMRPSMIPSMLNVISRNLRNSNFELNLFEIGKTFNHVGEQSNFIDGLSEYENLIFALSGSEYEKQWGYNSRNVDFFDIKGMFESLMKFLKIRNFIFSNNDNETIFTSESLVLMVNNKEIGVLGRINDKIMQRYEIEKPVYICSIKLAEIYNYNHKPNKYKPLSPFPRVYRDLAFIFDKSIHSEQILNVIKKSAGQLLSNITLFDIYEGKNIDNNKRSMAFNLEFTSFDKTMTDTQIEEYIETIVKNIEEKVGGKLRK